MAKSVNKNIEDIYSLSPLQEGMLFSSLIDENSSAYIIQLLFDVKFQMDEEIMIQALTLLSERYSVLRTSFFHQKIDKPRQIVLKNRQPEFISIDWSNKDSKDIEESYIQFKKSDIQRKFDLQHDPLLRVSHIKISPEKEKLIFTMHHIIMDGWCNKEIVGKFFYYYAQLTNGISYDKIEKEVKDEKSRNFEYKDYIKWLGKQDQKKALEYWKNLLSDYESEASLNAMDIPDHSDEQMRELYGSVPKNITLALKQIAESNESTLNTVAETAVGIMLHAYSGSSDAVFGKVVSGRNAPISGIEDIVGLFINTIPVRVTADDGITINELLKKQQLQGNESSNYDYCSLADIQNLTEQGSELIKVLYVFENFNSGVEIAAPNEGESLINLESGREQTSYALSISGYEENDKLCFKIMYDPNKYCENEVKMILDRLEKICKEMSENPDGLVSNIETITEYEEKIIINEFNSTEAYYPKHKTVVELFEEQVSRTPDNIAIVFGDEQLTYSELNRRANCLANKLRDLGVGANDFVAVIAERSIEMICAIYGIIKSGGAYVPIDPAYPEERIRFVIDDSSPKAVLKYTNSNIPVLNEASVIDLAESKIWEGSNSDPEHINTSDDLVYCIYTSGTTGKPKGVMNINSGLINRILWMNNRYPIGPGDTILQKTTFTFDVSVWEIFWWSIVGARAALLIPGGEKEPKEICSAIEQYNVTVMHFVPSMLSIFEEHVLSNVRNADKLKSLKNIFASGEALKLSHVEDFYKIVQMADLKMKLANFYGPTEASIDVTFYDCNNKDTNKIPIGKPISNTQIYIVSNNKLCGIGIPGELCIAGDGLARGYLNRPELTEEKFVKNPFGDGKMYHSGDLAMWLPDGNIEYLGRIDEQVKIRGFRIELGEIESRLREIEKINDCAVIARTDSTGDKAICAYYTSDSEIDQSEIRDKLSNNLPEYMIPAYIMRIDSIPVTKNGKLDKRSLPEIEARAAREYIPPRNEIEKKICDIFSEILNVEKVGINDGFFELGGHSLRATRLVNRIEAETGTRIALKDVFSNSTPKQLALLADGENEKYVPIPKAEEKEYYPMSSAQKRTYLIQQMETGSVTYNMPQNMKLTGEVRIDDLKAALQSMINRHEILRTQFIMANGELIQKIVDNVEAEFEYEISRDTDEKLMADYLQPFDLSKPPLVRAKLVNKGEYYLLMIDMHHIVGDGMSMNTFTKELIALYNGEKLAPLTHQYKDYSEWMSGRDLSEQKKYWKEQFSDEIPVLDIPTDFPRPQEQSYKGAITGVLLDEEICKKVKEAARASEATEYMVFLAAAMITLSKYSRQEDIVIGSPISGRTHKDTESMLGMFVNTLAMRGKPEKNKTFSGFLNEIKSICLKAYENQEYPFEELVEEIDVQRDMSRNPVFDVMLSMQNNEFTKLQLGESKTEFTGIESTIAKFDLSFDIAEYQDKFLITLEYCSDLFKAETADRMLMHFVNVLKSSTINTSQQLGNIEMVAEEEKKMILDDFNAAEKEYTEGNETIIGQLEKQAEITPDNIAVVFNKKSLTYKSLNELSNILAHKLREFGVRPNDFVAIIADRSTEMICGVYGILKSGAAYVPIDPEYPDERTRFILEDCKPKAVLKYTAKRLTFDSELIMIDLMQEDIWQGNIENPVQVNQNSDLAYCIYTSGTTGKSKGVLIEHRNLYSYVNQFIDYYSIDSDSVILQQAYIGFDTSIEELYPVLIAGGKMVIVDMDNLIDLDRLKETIVKEKINIISCSPLLIKEMDFLKDTSLKTLISGGDVLKNEFLEHIIDSKISIYNTYGPTEATVCASYYKVDSSRKTANIPIGKPIATSKIYILNDNSVCGIGVPGELCIAGKGVSRGYLNRPELTEEKFVNNPFGEGKMYRSGDLARWLPDGNIEYLGRIDEQVKIRGFRVELEEIDKHIREISNIDDCAVIAREDGAGVKSIYAYYTSDEEVDASEIKDRLKEILPHYMIPAYFMQIKSIPLTQNGKVDKKALPDIDVGVSTEYLAPVTEEEKVLAEAFCQILNIERVSTGDNFFDLGGDSIKAIRIISILRNQGYSVTVKDLMSGREIRKIAPMLKRSLREYEQGEVNGSVIKTPIIRMYDGYNFARPEYFNQSIIIDISYIPNDIIREAIEELIKYHDILRAVYKEGQLVILPSKESRIVDFYEFEYTSEENKIQAVYDKCTEIQGSMDLENGPLVKAAVFTLNEEKKLMLCIHHLVVDGVSWRILIEDFQTAVNQLMSGTNVKLPEKTASFIEWGKALDDYRSSGHMEDDLKYWDRMSDKFSEAKLIYEMDSDQFEGYSKVTLSINKSETENLLKKSGKAFNTEINDLLIAAFIKAFSRTNSQDKIIVYLESHGRAELNPPLDTDRTVGWFTSLYPVVIQAYDQWDETIIRTKDILHAVPNLGIAYGLAYDETTVLSDGIEFNYLGDMGGSNVSDTTSKDEIYSAGESIAPENKSLCSISVNGSITNMSLSFEITYDRLKFSEDKMKKLAKNYQDTLIEIANYCLGMDNSVLTASDFSDIIDTDDFDSIIDLI